jgi:hypothetical protein
MSQDKKTQERWKKAQQVVKNYYTTLGDNSGLKWAENIMKKGEVVFLSVLISQLNREDESLLMALHVNNLLPDKAILNDFVWESLQYDWSDPEKILEWAVEKHSTHQRLRILISHGVDINQQAHHWRLGNFLPIHDAVQKADLNAVQLLVNAGADLNFKCGWGQTPLDRCNTGLDLAPNGSFKYNVLLKIKDILVEAMDKNTVAVGS